MLALRLLCKELNLFISNHMGKIVREMLQNSLYRTASTLYHHSNPPYRQDFTHLHGMAHRCRVAQNLADFLAANHLFVAPWATITVDTVARNLYPYLLLLGHFMEEYRTSLANYVPRPRRSGQRGQNFRATIWNSRVQLPILAQYTPQAIHRLCFLFKRFREIATRLSYLQYVNAFPFAGLDLIADIIPAPTSSHRVALFNAHFEKHLGTPSTPAGPLSPSALPALDRPTMLRNYALLPSVSFMLDASRLSVHGIHHHKSGEFRRLEAEFISHLGTHGRETPRLMR